MSRLRPVLIVDSDADLRAALGKQLSLTKEFQVTEAGTARAAETMLVAPNSRFDAILLDVGLPDGDGRELCIRLRAMGLWMPVIMVSGAATEDDIVRGMDAGANDYIAKPFHPNELLARLRAHLRVFDNSDNAVLTIGPYNFRPSAKLLLDTRRDRRIRLTEKEAGILKFLYQAGGRAVPRQVLLSEIWGDDAKVVTHTVETHIYRLRKKMEPNPKVACLLLTEGGGYLLDPSECK